METLMFFFLVVTVDKVNSATCKNNEDPNSYTNVIYNTDKIFEPRSVGSIKSLCEGWTMFTGTEDTADKVSNGTMMNDEGNFLNYFDGLQSEHVGEQTKMSLDLHTQIPWGDYGVFEWASEKARRPRNIVVSPWTYRWIANRVLNIIRFQLPTKEVRITDEGKIDCKGFERAAILWNNMGRIITPTKTISGALNIFDYLSCETWTVTEFEGGEALVGSYPFEEITWPAQSTSKGALCFNTTIIPISYFMAFRIMVLDPRAFLISQRSSRGEQSVYFSGRRECQCDDLGSNTTLIDIMARRKEGESICNFDGIQKDNPIDIWSENKDEALLQLAVSLKQACREITTCAFIDKEEIAPGESAITTPSFREWANTFLTRECTCGDSRAVELKNMVSPNCDPMTCRSCRSDGNIGEVTISSGRVRGLTCTVTDQDYLLQESLSFSFRCGLALRPDAGILKTVSLQREASNSAEDDPKLGESSLWTFPVDYTDVGEKNTFVEFPPSGIEISTNYLDLGSGGNSSRPWYEACMFTDYGLFRDLLKSIETISTARPEQSTVTRKVFTPATIPSLKTTTKTQETPTEQTSQSEETHPPQSALPPMALISSPDSTPKNEEGSGGPDWETGGKVGFAIFMIIIGVLVIFLCWILYLWVFKKSRFVCCKCLKPDKWIEPNAPPPPSDNF